MWEELVNITKQIELHSKRYSKCHRSPGETVRDFRNLLLTHIGVKNMVTEETTRIVEISRVNTEFIERAWGKTRFSPCIKFAEQQLVDYTMDTQTTVVVEAATERVATTIDVEVEKVIVEAGARRGARTPVMEMMVGEAATSMKQANLDLRPETAMAATNPRAHIRVREEPKKPDRKLCMMCGKDAGHTTEESGKLRKFVANLKATDGHEPKHPQLNGYAQVVVGEEGKPRMPLMEIAKRLVKHEPVEDGWEKHVVMRALESKRVSISLMESYQLERSGGGMMESVMATTWGGSAMSSEPINSHAQSAGTSSGERAFEAAVMTVEEVADQQSGGKSTAEEKIAGGEAETERSFAIYRPGQLARQREEEEDRKRAKAQRMPARRLRRHQSETRRCLEQQAEVANQGIFALQPMGAEAKQRPETARLDTITCELHANNTMLQCETISDGGSSHIRMNASAMEPSAAEAVVKGAGGWVDVDMVVVLANGKRSCEQQRRLRDGVVFTLRDPVTSIMAAHHAPRVYENGGEAPGLLLGGPTITALGLRTDPATRICTIRAPNRPAGRVPLLSQTAWERRVREHQPVVTKHYY
eukprot:jgi/Tetstr1/453815/TSEL_040766.t1